MDHHDDMTRSIRTRLGDLSVRTSGAGAPVVLWPSLFADSRSWHRLLEPLAREHQVILIDGPSHGGSSPTRHRFTLADCAGAATDVLDALEVVDPVHWVGNAWGGHVGILFAGTEPARVRSVVAIGTPVRALTAAERARFIPMVYLYRLVGPIGLLIAEVSKALLGPDADPQDAQLITSTLQAADRRGLYEVMQSIMLHRPSLLPELPAVAAPTLFITGDQDPLLNPQDSQQAVARLPRGFTTTIPGGGHVSPLLRHAPRLFELITGFWQQQAKESRRPDEAGQAAPNAGPPTGASSPATTETG